MSTSTSGPEPDTTTAWPQLPTETEIYILAGGQVVIADLPAELAPALAHLGQVEPYALDVQVTVQPEQSDRQ